MTMTTTGSSWRMVIESRKSIDDFDYWEYYDSINGWYYVPNDITCMRRRSIVDEISGALFASGKYE